MEEFRIFIPSSPLAREGDFRYFPTLERAEVFTLRFLGLCDGKDGFPMYPQAMIYHGEVLASVVTVFSDGSHSVIRIPPYCAPTKPSDFTEEVPQVQDHQVQSAATLNQDTLLNRELIRSVLLHEMLGR